MNRLDTIYSTISMNLTYDSNNLLMTLIKYKKCVFLLEILKKVCFYFEIRIGIFPWPVPVVDVKMFCWFGSCETPVVDVKMFCWFGSCETPVVDVKMFSWFGSCETPVVDVKMFCWFGSCETPISLLPLLYLCKSVTPPDSMEVKIKRGVAISHVINSPAVLEFQMHYHQRAPTAARHMSVLWLAGVTLALRCSYPRMENNSILFQGSRVQSKNMYRLNEGNWLQLTLRNPQYVDQTQHTPVLHTDESMYCTLPSTLPT